MTDEAPRRDDVGRLPGPALRCFQPGVLEPMAMAGHEEVNPSPIHCAGVDLAARRTPIARALRIGQGAGSDDGMFGSGRRALAR